MPKNNLNEIQRQFEVEEIPEESRITGLYNLIDNEDHREDLFRKYFREVREGKILDNATTFDMAPKNTPKQVDILGLQAEEPKPVQSNGRKVFKYDI